jgi:hypothetical protein
VLSLLLISVLAQSPDYDAFSDRDGNILTERHGRALFAMLQKPGMVERLFADAAKGDRRAKRIVETLEADYFPDTGRELAEKVSRPPCLVPALRELSGWCVPEWSFLDFLDKDKPGGARLRKALFDGFAERIRVRGLENQIVLSAMTALLGISVAAMAIEAGEATASLKQILADAKPFSESKPGMGSTQFKKTGGWDAANRDFDVLARGRPVKSYAGNVRSCEFPDGTTASVRPMSSGEIPTVQIDSPKRNPIKIRYE